MSQHELITQTILQEQLKNKKQNQTRKSIYRNWMGIMRSENIRNVKKKRFQKEYEVVWSSMLTF